MMRGHVRNIIKFTLREPTHKKPLQGLCLLLSLRAAGIIHRGSCIFLLGAKLEQDGLILVLELRGRSPTAGGCPRNYFWPIILVSQAYFFKTTPTFFPILSLPSFLIDMTLLHLGALKCSLPPIQVPNYQLSLEFSVEKNHD